MSEISYFLEQSVLKEGSIAILLDFEAKKEFKRVNTTKIEFIDPLSLDRKK